MSTEFIELAGKTGQQMPYHRVMKAQRLLNDLEQPVKGSKIAVFGVSYKPGVGDIRESPALKIVELPQHLGAHVAYHDPHVPAVPGLGLQHTPLEQALEDARLAIVVTAHPGVEQERIPDTVPAVLDMRGILQNRRVPNLVRL